MTKQILTPRFLQTILLDEPYRSSIPRQGVHIVGAILEESLDLSYASLDANVFFEDSRFKRALVLTGLRTSGSLKFDGSMFLGTVHLNGAEIQGLLSLAGDTRTFDGLNLDLLSAGYLALKGEVVRDGTYRAPMFTSDHEPAVWLSHAKIRTLVDMSDAAIAGLTMSYAEVGQELRLRNVFLKGAVDITNARIGGDLVLEGPTSGPRDSTPRQVDLTATRIGGTLIFGSTGYGPMRWPKESRLILRDASANDVQDGIDSKGGGSWTGSWPTHLELEGFTYQNLGIASRRAEWLTQDWLGCPKEFSPEPFEQLASYFLKRGYDAASQTLLYEKKNCELRWTPYPGRFWLATQRALIGYGYRIERAWYWVLGLTLAGALLLNQSRQGDEQGFLYGAAYSLDMLLPMIGLDEAHKKVRLTGWVRYYFYFQRLMGWVLASFLIAGLSGLTK